MNQQHGFLPPPPPPNASGGPGTPPLTPGESYPQRRRPGAAQPPSIRTNFLRTHGVGSSSQTPASGLSGHGTPFPFSPVTPVALNPRTQGASHAASQATSPGTPSAAMEPYNPRQWSQRQVSGTQRVFQRAANVPTSTRETTGMEESMPSPPPPYSPENGETAQFAGRGSPMLDSMNLTTSPAAVESPARQSPQIPMSPAFAPPPTQSQRHRERSASGLAGQRSFFSSLSGLRGKQPVNVESPMSTAVEASQQADIRPPAARRAASAGHIGHSIAPSPVPGPSERSSPVNSWQPGMPLPGPPPGPPPPGTRSQSLNRYGVGSSRSNSLTSENGFDSQHTRRAAAVSTLGPVPPTPADWVDTDADPNSQQQQQQQQSLAPGQPDADNEVVWQPLRIDTGAHREQSLSRRPARRDTSTQGIRERRSHSRRAKSRSNDILSPVSDDSRPSDLIFTPVNDAIKRRREHMRSVSGYAEPSDAPRESPSQPKPRPAQPTPLSASVMTPPYTPAVGKDEASRSRGQSLKVPNSASSDRPISHLLHTPNEDAAMAAPLSPARPPSAGSMKTSTRLDAFALQAMERHRAFVEKEAAANTDEERLELFANFMVHESRLRRDRYSAAYNSMAGDIVDLTRDMWRSYTRMSKRAVTPSTSMSSFDQTVPSWASDGRPASAQGGMPSSASSFGDFTPATDTGSIGEPNDIERSDSRHWAESFKPSLSPIPSMAVSTVPDEDSSRGRTQSRWWEQSQSGSGSGSIGKPDRMEKTHRETKYMGVNLAKLQGDAEPSPALSRHTATPGASTQTFGLGANEYPAEKTGWHEGVDFDTPMATPAHVLSRKTSTPGFEPLDVSRLVTLPPPYPRHHPAINNSHPSLAHLRSEHRALADHSEIQQIKDAYMEQDFTNQGEQAAMAKERRAALRSSIQAKVASGSISYAAAASAEADFDAEEAERCKATARSNFDVFENSVAQPLNTLINARLARANAAIDQLRAELAHRDETSDPNHAQEEGDEEPERLEKLTLLKWLFEAREHAHAAMFELHADRSAKYAEVILTPYRIQNMQSKIDEAQAFFTKDARERQTAFAKDALRRVEELQLVVEGNVSRGVEDQLSAFWDIAPDLLAVIQHVPHSPEDHDFEVRIPAAEYDENPAYHAHPLQYLYSLLSHAEKSTYQFIESQTNLLCLLHEVRSKSSLRMLEMERLAQGRGDVEAEMAVAKRVMEEQVTEDLKEKVGEVERQWREALGEGLEECKGRVRRCLEVCGGWEEGLDG